MPIVNASPAEEGHSLPEYSEERGQGQYLRYRNLSFNTIDAKQLFRRIDESIFRYWNTTLFLYPGDIDLDEPLLTFSLKMLTAFKKIYPEYNIALHFPERDKEMLGDRYVELTQALTEEVRNPDAKDSCGNVMLTVKTSEYADADRADYDIMIAGDWPFHFPTQGYFCLVPLGEEAEEIEEDVEAGEHSKREIVWTDCRSGTVTYEAV
ncbi:hypothetical protein KEU06_15535 [Pseudaminobacter sp. 19-2017]|uniref:Uncharacterized protein n=1 Tax=Pseudaminobacter soli (ex Zhang et al. 2022) TaxID=2831468 RepID=A0A942E3Q1_9HYPH|nr:hypothetical protein [Pseudaminobacter soli]MBS3650025.1 hypothetical protein [Pseudaminobacter soli]